MSNAWMGLFLPLSLIAAVVDVINKPKPKSSAVNDRVQEVMQPNTEQVLSSKNGDVLSVFCDKDRSNLVYIVRGKTGQFDQHHVAVAVVHQPDSCK